LSSGLTKSIAALAGVLILCASCTLEEGSAYVVQDAPPSGIHVTLKVSTTDILRVLSDAVEGGAEVDRELAKNGLGEVDCDAYPNTQYYGDRCAFRAIRATPVTGTLARDAARRLYWDDARSWDEFDDFRGDSMAQIRNRAKSCIHVTIKNVGDWPVEWRDSNWTWRDRSDPKC
jgi:hypothetical protein